MKILSVSLLLVLLLITFFYPATPDSFSTICIITRDDDVAAFRTIGRIFNSLGFDLEDSEEALMVVSTEIMNKDYGVFNLKKLAVKLRAEISMADSFTTIKLTGNFLENADRSSELSESYFVKYSNPITKAAASDQAAKTAWDIMFLIAQKYKNGKLRLDK